MLKSQLCPYPDHQDRGSPSYSLGLQHATSTYAHVMMLLSKLLVMSGDVLWHDLTQNEAGMCCLCQAAFWPYAFVLSLAITHVSMVPNKKHKKTGKRKKRKKTVPPSTSLQSVRVNFSAKYVLTFSAWKQHSNCFKNAFIQTTTFFHVLKRLLKPASKDPKPATSRVLQPCYPCITES